MNRSASYQKDIETKVVRGAEEALSTAGHYAEKAIDAAQSTAKSVADQGRDVGERVNEVAGNFKTALDKSVTTQPLTTLVTAAAVGFVLGALWKS